MWKMSTEILTVLSPVSVTLVPSHWCRWGWSRFISASEKEQPRKVYTAGRDWNTLESWVVMCTGDGAEAPSEGSGGCTEGSWHSLSFQRGTQAASLMSQPTGLLLTMLYCQWNKPSRLLPSGKEQEPGDTSGAALGGVKPGWTMKTSGTVWAKDFQNMSALYTPHTKSQDLRLKSASFKPIISSRQHIFIKKEISLFTFWF